MTDISIGQTLNGLLFITTINISKAFDIMIIRYHRIHLRLIFKVTYVEKVKDICLIALSIYLQILSRMF